MTAHPTRRQFDIGTVFHIADTTLGAVGGGDRPSRARIVGVGVVFVWFLVGGIAHFAATELEMRIVPPYIPWPRAAVLITGVFELLGALALLWRPSRRWAGMGLFVLTIAVTPAHIYMLQRPELFSSIPIWALWVADVN